MSNVIHGTVATKGNINGNITTVFAKDGKSAYEVAVKNGFEGTETDWLASLKGEKGEQGIQGEKGEQGVDGKSGVYVGSGEMSDDCNVQIDPQGDTLTIKDIVEAVAEAIGGVNRHAEYFSITDDGVLSLKPKYRGEVNFDKYKTLSLDFGNDYTYAISDNGENYVGSKNHILPQDLVIPPIIDGIEVKGFQVGAFAFNDRIRTLTIPSTITNIPTAFADMSVNLWDIKGIENIETVGDKAFRTTALETFTAEKISNIGNDVFHYCSRLRAVNLGQKLTAIGDDVFYGCYKLTNVRCKNVVEVGTRAFARTFSLYQCDFLKSGNIITIGDYAFMSSAIPFDWKNLGEEFVYGKNATWQETTNTDIKWEDIDFVECENPLPTNMSQKDGRWANELFFVSDGKEYYYGNGACNFFTMLQSYCALKDVQCSVLEQLQAIHYYHNNKSIYDTFSNPSLSKIPGYITSLGLTCDYRVLVDDHFITQDEIQKIYDALNSGKYVFLTIPSNKGNYGYGHAVLAYGVTNDGRLLIADSANVGSWNGDKGGKKYKMHPKQLIYTHKDCYSAYFIIGDDNAVPSQLETINTELENCLEGN